MHNTTNGNSLINPFNFVRISRRGDSKEVLELGLTKREYFAARALQGILSDAKAVHQLAECPSGLSPQQVAVMYADALIEALNAKEDTDAAAS